jgi:hypothetical protein
MITIKEQPAARLPFMRFVAGYVKTRGGDGAGVCDAGRWPGIQVGGG